MSGHAQTPAQRPDPRRSGFDMMSPDLQRMQADDASNPAMLWARQGEALWNEPPLSGRPSCAACHGNAAVSMRGVAARHPAFDEKAGKPVDLAGRIMQCRAERQQAAPFARESQPLLALSTYVAMQSRGLGVAPPDDPRLAPFRARGEALYRARIGQLNLSCAGCHETNAGQKLGGNVIPQAHPTGYPIYRLEWQDVGSLQRRLRNCLVGVRAEPFAYGADEYLALELFLMRRAAGMALDAPGVRP